jgi:hypothetical protein
MGSRSNKSNKYGAPIGGTPKPGGTTRKRPKVGDKDSGWKKPEKGGKPKKIKTENPPGGPKTPGAKKKSPGGEGSTFRDYRGTEGVVEDANKGKK